MSLRRERERDDAEEDEVEEKEWRKRKLRGSRVFKSTTSHLTRTRQSSIDRKEHRQASKSFGALGRALARKSTSAFAQGCY